MSINFVLKIGKIRGWPHGIVVKSGMPLWQPGVCRFQSWVWTYATRHPCCGGNPYTE